MTDAVVLLSGGLDSTVLLAREFTRSRPEVVALAVDYGQRHVRELDAARAVAARYAVRLEVADLRPIARMFAGSALTDPARPVPADDLRATVVPNRNAILLMVAVGLAVTEGCPRVLTAVHAGDRAVYPDCRPAFVQAASKAARLGTEGFGDVTVEAPFVRMSKADVVWTGAALGAPLGATWSCYVGGARHCGRCSACTTRARAFAEADIPDPTDYEVAL